MIFEMNISLYIYISFCAQEKWTGNITFLVGNKIEDFSHIDVLANGVKNGAMVRRLFSILSYDDLMQEVS